MYVENPSKSFFDILLMQMDFDETSVHQNYMGKTYHFNPFIDFVV